MLNLVDGKVNAENDHSYLENDEAFVERVVLRINAEKLSENCREKLKDTYGKKLLEFIEKIKNTEDFTEIRKDLFDETRYPVPDIYNFGFPVDFKFAERQEVIAGYLSAILRLFILRTKDQTVEETHKKREEYRARVRNDYSNFEDKSFEDGSFEETNDFSYFYFFERAIKLLKSFINPHRNTGLFLLVGNILEGCPNEWRYGTGQVLCPETKRRNLLIELITGMPKKAKYRSSTFFSRHKRAPNPFPFIGQPAPGLPIIPHNSYFSTNDESPLIENSKQNDFQQEEPKSFFSSNQHASISHDSYFLTNVSGLLLEVSTKNALTKYIEYCAVKDENLERAGKIRRELGDLFILMRRFHNLFESEESFKLACEEQVKKNEKQIEIIQDHNMKLLKIYNSNETVNTKEDSSKELQLSMIDLNI